MIKLVAMDLDGTLLHHDKTISDYTKQVLQKVKAKGVHLVLCTGRPIAAIQRYLKELDLFDDDDYSITFNGGLVQHNQSERVVSSHLLSGKEAQFIATFLNQHHMTYDMVQHQQLWKPSGQVATFYESLNKVLALHEFQEVNTTLSYNKIVVTGEPEQMQTWVPVIQEELQGKYYLVRSMPQLFEIAPLGVNKAEGIKALAKHLNIALEDIAAFGDEANDCEMLAEVGYGVAMGNANEAIQQQARYVTLTNDEDGVAKALEQLVLD